MKVYMLSRMTLPNLHDFVLLGVSKLLCLRTMTGTLITLPNLHKPLPEMHGTSLRRVGYDHCILTDKAMVTPHIVSCV